RSEKVVLDIAQSGCHTDDLPGVVDQVDTGDVQAWKPRIKRKRRSKTRPINGGEVSYPDDIAAVVDCRRRSRGPAEHGREVDQRIVWRPGDEWQSASRFTDDISGSVDASEFQYVSRPDHPGIASEDRRAATGISPADGCSVIAEHRRVCEPVSMS